MDTFDLIQLGRSRCGAGFGCDFVGMPDLEAELSGAEKQAIESAIEEELKGTTEQAPRPVHELFGLFKGDYFLMQHPGLGRYIPSDLAWYGVSRLFFDGKVRAVIDWINSPVVYASK